MSELLEAASDSAEALPLDPFGACPSWASRIAGLGGEETSPDPSYVFATGDCLPAIGRVAATVRFDGLTITQGTLLFEVRVRSAVPGAEQHRLKTIVVDAAELMSAGGIVELDFDGHRNAYYGIACGINDETDIAASGLSVTLDRRATPTDHGREWEWSEVGAAPRRRRGSEAALIGRSMTDLAMPLLERPQSQVGSPLQCAEPAFAEAMQALRRPSVASFENWSLAYVLRAIARFSGEGARRMLAFGEHMPLLLSYFAARESEVVGMQYWIDRETPFNPGEALEKQWVPEQCGEAEFFAHAHLTAGDIRHPFDTFRDHFDVLWSIGANRLMTPEQYVYFVVDGLIHAKPGGLAVHVFDYVEDVDAARGTSLARHHIERIAALALSFGHDVARLQFQHGAVPPDASTPLPFGLTVLRGGGPD